MTASPTGRALLLRDTMRRFAKSVVLVTCSWKGRDYVMPASAVDSVSFDPPSMMICVNRNASMWSALAEGADFAINLLAADQQHLAEHCTVAKGDDRFVRGDWIRTPGAPARLSDAPASILCRQATSLTYGTHQIFIGEVVDGDIRDRADRLVYSDGAYRVLPTG